MSDGQERHLVLVGMMGSGKTSVGRRLALRLGRPFVDTDRLVEEQAGKTVAEIFAQDGEPVFRTLESEVVRQALASGPYAVIAFGGGAVLDAANRELARKSALVVWLQAPVRELARRVAASHHRTGGTARPLLSGGNTTETLEELARAREDAYRAAAHLLIDTISRSPGQVAAAILRAAGWEEPS